MSLVANAWYHMALAVNTSGWLALVINGTEILVHELLWDPAPTQSPLTSSTDATAIGRGAPTWQNGGVHGKQIQDACFEVDELRFWTECRTVSDIVENMHTGCRVLAAAVTGQTLVACYSFDEPGDGGLDDFFPDAGSPHRSWCVNMDDRGELRLDSEDVSHDWSSIEMWGYCSSKPRLPGAGFHYSEVAIEATNAHRLEGTAAVLQHYPGCGDVPLR
jgi:hypothetical protein